MPASLPLRPHLLQYAVARVLWVIKSWLLTGPESTSLSKIDPYYGVHLIMAPVAW